MSARWQTSPTSRDGFGQSRRGRSGRQRQRFADRGELWRSAVIGADRLWFWRAPCTRMWSSSRSIRTLATTADRCSGKAPARTARPTTQFWSNLERAGVAERIRYVRARSQDALNDVTGPIDLLYIDGAHRYRVVVGDLAGWGSRVRPGGTFMIHDAFNSVGVTSALMRRMLLSPEFRYVRRCQSLAEYRREPVGGIAQLRNVARQLAAVPWFLRNVAIRTLNAVGLGGVTRLLGYQGDGTY